MADPVLDLPKFSGEMRQTICYLWAVRSGINVCLKPSEFGEQKRRMPSKQPLRYGLEWTK